MIIRGSNKIITDGLVLHLDAANKKSYGGPSTPTTWNDLSGYGNHGVVGGTAIGDYRISHINNSMYWGGFSNYTRYFRCDNREILNITGNEITLESWVNTSTDATRSYYYGIISKRFSYGSGKNSYNLYFDNTVGSRRISFSVGTYGGNRIINSNTGNKLNDGNWHHVAGVYNGVNVVLYVDGILQDDIIASTSNILIQEYPLYIGSMNLNGVPHIIYNYLDYISVAKIYNRGLSEVEVIQNYNALKSRYGL